MYKLFSKTVSIVLILATVLTSPGFLPALGITIFEPDAVFAAFNDEINYQGKLTNASNVAVADGTYHMRFALYTVVSGGSAIWSEDRSTAAGDRATVTNGLFSIMLGSSTALTSIDFNQTLYLGVEVGGSGGAPSWDGEMAPRKILGAVPAAFTAKNVDGGTIDNVSRSTTTSATTSSLAITGISSSLLKTASNGALLAAVAGTDYLSSAITTLGGTYSTGQTGATQTFATGTADANLEMTITSAGNIHTFTPTWAGTLSIARGGTNATSFPTNSLIAFDGTRQVGTTSPTVGWINATSTTATSTFAGTFSVGSSTPPATTLFSVSSTTAQLPNFIVTKDGSVGINTVPSLSALSISTVNTATNRAISMTGIGDNVSFALLNFGTGGRKYEFLSTSAGYTSAPGSFIINDDSGGGVRFAIS